MMRTIKPEEFDVFLLDELEPDAQEKAAEAVAAKLGGDWWDQSDIDDTGDVIAWELAHKLGTPEHEDYGVGDFPGIPGLEVIEWDADRGTIEARGTLTPADAPALPWDDTLVQVTLHNAGHWRATYIDVDTDVDEMSLSAADRAALQDRQERMREAVKQALSDALAAGQREVEYKSSAEYAREHAEVNELEFYADGRLYG